MTHEKPQRLVVVASSIIDVTLDIPRFPERGGDVLATPVAREPGGSFNVASAARRLGLPTVYAGPLGTGPNADLLHAACSRDDIGFVGTPAYDDLGYCIAMVEPGGERTFVSVGGADSRMSADELSGIPWQPGDTAYISGYDLAYNVSGPVLSDAVQHWPVDVDIVLDPGPLVADVPWAIWQHVVSRVALLSWSQREASLLPSLLNLLPDDAVVVRRLGSEGAALTLPRAAEQVVQTKQVTPVDTNGAGDVHVGALLAERHAGLSWPEAVRSANLAAAMSTLRRGGASGPTREELLRFSSET